MNTHHSYSSSLHGFQISPYLQERMTLVGQSEVYSESNNLLNRLLCIETNHMQICRVTDRIGSLSTDIINAASINELSISANDVVYAQADGAMVLTRESKWQEVKTGRIFKQSDIMELSEHRNELKNSLYVSHLGHYSGFLEKFEPMVDKLDHLGNRLVFLSDGVTWLRHWGVENYPNATHILDFYHACEHLGATLDLLCKDEILRKSLFKTWKELLLEQSVEALIARINTDYEDEKLTETKRKSKQQLFNYLNTNAYRMNYAEYRKRGLVIGSGAIEAAQRTVVQKRLKRAGQRWSENGIQNMLNLRVAYLSNKWQNVKEVIIKRNAA